MRPDTMQKDVSEMTFEEAIKDWFEDNGRKYLE